MTEEAVGSGPGGGGRVRRAARTDERTGWVAYLVVVQECISKRCELLGLAAPTTVEAEVRAEGAGPLLGPVRVLGDTPWAGPDGSAAAQVGPA